MKLFRSLDNFPESLRGGAVAIGNFDGIHRGHARLIEQLKAMAHTVGGPAIVMTFDPPPTRILHPEAAPEPLMWLERKIAVLDALGLDAVLVYPTDLSLLETEARAFFDRVVLGRLGARAMVEGPNFFFGHNRSGNVETLGRFCVEADMPFEVTRPVEIAGKIVSSSRIRALVMDGLVSEAGSMLGRPHRIRGLVVRGAGRGATIGYATANLDQIDTLVPAEGIYAVRAWAKNAWHPAAASLGPNPTFDEGRLKIEVHLIGFEGDLYGEPMEVDFIARLRDIKRFPSVAELVEQMALDVEKTVTLVRESN